MVELIYKLIRKKHNWWNKVRLVMFALHIHTSPLFLLADRSLRQLGLSLDSYLDRSYHPSYSAAPLNWLRRLVVLQVSDWWHLSCLCVETKKTFAVWENPVCIPLASRLYVNIRVQIHMDPLEIAPLSLTECTSCSRHRQLQ